MGIHGLVAEGKQRREWRGGERGERGGGTVEGSDGRKRVAGQQEEGMGEMGIHWLVG